MYNYNWTKIWMDFQRGNGLICNLTLEGFVLLSALHGCQVSLWSSKTLCSAPSRNRCKFLPTHWQREVFLQVGISCIWDWAYYTEWPVHASIHTIRDYKQERLPLKKGPSHRHSPLRVLCETPTHDPLSSYCLEENSTLEWPPSQRTETQWELFTTNWSSHMFGAWSTALLPGQISV